MAATTHPEFHGHTEALEVANAFPDAIRGKTVLVTGVNQGGIGFTTSQAFASQSPGLLIIAGRNSTKIQQSIDTLKTEYPNVNYRPIVLDLSSQETVRTAAAELLSWTDVPTVDIVVNSAGVMGVDERTINKDGIELHFATNHIGHFLFTCLIMPKLIAASKSNPSGATRIVNVSAYSPIVSTMRWSDMNFEKKNKDLPLAEQPPYDWFKPWGYKDMEEKAYIPLDGYMRSKVANCLFGIDLNRRLFNHFGIFSTSLFPGIILTELSRNFNESTMASIQELMGADHYKDSVKTLGAGASTSMVAALDPQLAIGVGESKDGKENYGAFMVNCQINGDGHPLAISSAEAEKLWELSEKLTGQNFAW